MRRLSAEEYAAREELVEDLAAAGYSTEALPGENTRDQFHRLESLAGVLKARQLLHRETHVDTRQRDELDEYLDTTGITDQERDEILKIALHPSVGRAPLAVAADLVQVLNAYAHETAPQP